MNCPNDSDHSPNEMVSFTVSRAAVAYLFSFHLTAVVEGGQPRRAVCASWRPDDPVSSLRQLLSDVNSRPAWVTRLGLALLGLFASVHLLATSLPTAIAAAIPLVAVVSLDIAGPATWPARHVTEMDAAAAAGDWRRTVITDNHGVRVDDAVAVHRLVVARDLRFPDDAPGDRLGRLFAEVGELADAILTIEQGTPFPLANPGGVLAEAMFDVMRAAGCIAHHYQLAVGLPDSKGYLRANNSYVLLGLLIQAGGALVQIVVDQMMVRPNMSAEAGPASDELARAVDLVIIRTLVLAEHYGLRHELRSVIQNSYRTHQDDGFLP